MSHNATKNLAKFAVETNYDNLTPEVVQAAKRLILDTVGCAIGGYSTDIAKIVTEFKRESGGTPESTILVTGERTSCTNAAYVNTVLSNALDAEETLINSGHPSGCVVTPSLAVGEKLGVSGKQLIESVALGYEIAARIGLALQFVLITPDGKTQFSPVAGMGWAIFGAAVAAAKLLHQDENEMIRTIGLAANMAPVPTAGKWVNELKKSPRPMSKYGFLAPMSESGITAAFLVQKGFLSDTSALDGDRGFWRSAGSLACDWDLMLNGLNERWFLNETSYKPYPNCRYIHGPLDIFLRIMSERSLSPREIHEVKVKVPGVTVNCHLDEVLKPQNEIDIQFSIQYCIAIAAYYPRPGPEWLAHDKRIDPRIVELASRVNVEEDKAATQAMNKQLIEEGRFRSMPCSLEVVTKGGDIYASKTEFAKGDPWSNETIMSDSELADKFRAFSYGYLRNSKIENAIQNINNVDRLESIDTLMHCLHQ
jgi:2-methylcitrate dehydratase PrpD